MQNKHISTIVGILAVFTLIGLGAYAFADPGRDYGRSGRGMGYYGDGGGDCEMGYGYRRGYGRNSFYSDLSDEEIKKLDEERSAFFEATDDLKRKIYQKRLELRSELANKEPDEKNALTIQKDLSSLEAQLDQKRIGHLIKIKKINPDLAGIGRGYHGKSKGPHGRFHSDHCW
jgi:hypothetical protein